MRDGIHELRVAIRAAGLIAGLGIPLHTNVTARSIEPAPALA
ncbi:MAG: hypothetical protein OEU92_06705 [Alphaproteobacteria bacterium]|nr:hypothetical protein [Alphaproteobacteria bacterium]